MAQPYRPPYRTGRPHPGSRPVAGPRPYPPRQRPPAPPYYRPPLPPPRRKGRAGRAFLWTLFWLLALAMATVGGYFGALWLLQ